MNDRITFAHFT